MDICVITDYDGTLQGVIPIPTTTGKAIGLIKYEKDVEQFKKALIEYVNEYYWDETDILDVEISPRFFKYESTEVKFTAEDDEFFHLNIQLTGVDTPQKDTYVLRHPYEQYIIAVIHASTVEELLHKVNVALREEEGFEDDWETKVTMPNTNMDWGVVSILYLEFEQNGKTMKMDYHIVKSIQY